MTWNITAPLNYGVLVNFNHFHVEQSYDYLRIYAGSIPSFGDSTQIGVYSGSSLPANIESRDMYLWITFTSDTSVAYSGFEMEVSALDLAGTIHTILHFEFFITNIYMYNSSKSLEIIGDYLSLLLVIIDAWLIPSERIFNSL